MTPSIVFDAASRRRTLVLSVSQALLMIGTSTMIAEAALVGHMLADNKSLATVPVALMQLVVMLATFPMSFLMKRYGRRAGFTLGAACGIAGQALCVYAIFGGSFLLFCAGSAINGVYNSAGQFYRFAAADGVGPSLRPKAISYVLAGGVAAAVIGPEIARLTHDMFEPVAFGGSFAALALLACLALLVVQRIDIPVPTGEEQTGAARPLAELLAQPKAAVAVFAGAVGYAVMSLVMNATPLAMIACGMAFGDAARTIQAHVLAMFVPSFFTGSIIGRFGVVRVMAVGAALLLGSAAVVLAGIEFWNFYAGLILLGLGWNFLYIGATSLLTETYKPAEKAKMQAANDSIVFGSVALAAALSGWMHNIVGWEAINFGALPPVGLALAALLWLALRNRRRGAA
jgi:MFS family permease